MKLSKFVGRNQLPTDKSAFDRLAKVFANDTPGPVNTQRRQRVERTDGKTELSNKGETK